MGFEPTTPTLARLCSTPELHPLAAGGRRQSPYMTHALGECKRRGPAADTAAGRS